MGQISQEILARSKLLAGTDVLIVEDSPTQALQVQQALEDHALKVRLARDGVEGLELVHQQAPQIIVCDIEMPRMNGYEFCKHIKTDSALKAIPVILLTNLSDAMDAIKGIECGADSFMTKPYDLKLLLSNICDLLENRSNRDIQVQSQPVETSYGGHRHQLNVNQAQVVDLLLSTYSNAIHKNLELEEAYRKLTIVHQEIERKNAELLRLNEQKNQLVGMAAHDLRNPLGVIQAYSMLLIERLSSKVDADANKMLGHIHQTSAFMLQLINDLLDISSIESGKVSLNLKHVDLMQMVREHVELESTFAARKHIQLVIKGDDAVPLVLCDPDKMAQVLNNLLSNAIKFSHPDSTVELSITHNPKEIIISVKDSGIGISKSDQERIFMPFSKCSGRGTAGEACTGLGLAIVNKILHAHHGKIWVDSEPGKGSTFSFSIPYEFDRLDNRDMPLDKG